jgi:hypothetical protein
MLSTRFRFNLTRLCALGSDCTNRVKSQKTCACSEVSDARECKGFCEGVTYCTAGNSNAKYFLRIQRSTFHLSAAANIEKSACPRLAAHTAAAVLLRMVRGHWPLTPKSRTRVHQSGESRNSQGVDVSAPVCHAKRHLSSGRSLPDLHSITACIQGAAPSDSPPPRSPP